MSGANGFFIDASEIKKIISWAEEVKQRASQNSQAMYNEIGIYMKAQTLRNFKGQHDPGGGKWAPHSSVTTERRRKGSKKGNGNKILQVQGAAGLMGSIGYTLTQDGVIIGTVQGNVNSVLNYARAMQYGLKPKETRVSIPDVNGRYYSRMMKIPWGPVPARPFVGINEKNAKYIKRIIKRYILLDENEKGGEA